MIKYVKVTNHLGESITLPMVEPDSSGFIIRDIHGLSPSKADIRTTEIMSGHGASFNSAHINKRNIVLTLEFLDNPAIGRTIEDVRLLSYKYFPIQQPITIEVETENRVAQVEGRAESNEADIFEKGEKANISIICPSAFLHSKSISVTAFSGLEPLFEFPFSNESLTEKLLEMGNIVNITQRIISYDGDAPTGMIITLHAIGTVVNPRIVKLDTGESMTIDTNRLTAMTGSGMTAGDDIVISTVRGDKYVSLMRNGQKLNIFNCLDKNTDWLEIQNGDNAFAYMAEYGISNLQFRIEYQILYEGL